MNKYQHIVFDFDGTIADSIELALQSYNHIAHDFKLNPLTDKDRALIRSKRPQDIFKSSAVSKLKLPLIMLKVKKQMNHSIGEMNLIEGMETALQELKEQAYKLGILSSNSVENIQKFLQHHQLQHIFDFVVSERSLFGKDKTIKRIMKTKGIDKQDFIYVGDESRDIEAGRKAGVASIAVSWGLNDEQILTQSQPDYLIHHPRDLMTTIQAYFNSIHKE